MPPSKLARKLKPVRKAWKTFTARIKSKLYDFHVPSSIKVATHRVLDFCSLHLFYPLKRRFLSKYSLFKPRRRYDYTNNHLYHYEHYRSQLLKNREVIYIDQLYTEQQSMSLQAKHFEQRAESSRRNEAVQDKEKGKADENEDEGESGIDSIEDAWKVVVAKSPHLRGVDERADEFIYKFREDRKLEKERSDLDFQEMLARST